MPLGKKDWATRPLEFSVGDVGGSAKKQKDVALLVEVEGVAADATGLCDSSKKGSSCPDSGFLREATPVLESLCVDGHCRSAWSGCRCTRWSKTIDSRCLSLSDVNSTDQAVYEAYMRVHSANPVPFLCKVWDPQSCNASINLPNFELERGGGSGELLPAAYHLRGCTPENATDDFLGANISELLLRAYSPPVSAPGP